VATPCDTKDVLDGTAPAPCVESIIVPGRTILSVQILPAVSGAGCPASERGVPSAILQAPRNPSMFIIRELESDSMITMRIAWLMCGELTPRIRASFNRLGREITLWFPSSVMSLFFESISQGNHLPPGWRM
jgi:hypothetical protein